MVTEHVSTLVVEWIEIRTSCNMEVVYMSPPSWWSGLKSNTPDYQGADYAVSTLVVEWIEILQ